MSLRHLAAAVAAIGIISGSVVPARATVPSTFSYQGVLTDNGGNLVANGSYNLTFSLYTVPSGGSAQWTETQNAVPVSKGGFSVVLGSVTPIGISFDQQLYLGIAVNGGAELAPRVVLTPAPQSLALRLPYMGITNGTQASLSLINDGTGRRGLFVESSGYFGNTSYGSVLVGGPGQPFAVARMFSTGAGGQFSFYSATTGLSAGELQVNPGTNSGVISLRRNTGNTSFFVDADNSGSGDPIFAVQGVSRSLLFNAAVAGDASVSLPANAISSGEVLDEPGIAQGHNASSVGIGSSPANLISVQITTPASGYIVVEAAGMHGIGGNGVAENEVDLSISETSGVIDYTNYYVSGFTSGAPNGLFRTSASLRRTWFKAAGTYTFYFTAVAYNPSSLSNYMWNPTLTATFFPTSYGTVTAIASRAEASQNGLESRSVSSSSPSGGERVPGNAVEVDLRTLELRLAKMREATAQAEAELLRARFAKSPEVMSVSASAPEVQR